METVDARDDQLMTTRQRYSPGWIIIGLSGWIVLGFILKLVFALVGNLAPEIDSVPDIVIFGSLAATFAARGIEVLRSNRSNRGIMIGVFFTGSFCWTVFTAITLGKLVAP